MKYIRMSLFFALVLGLLLMVSPAAFAAEEGTCGPNATWRFENSTLTISGTGLVTEICWYEFHNRILKVVVEPGIMNLPENAFHGCEFLTDVSLPEGLIKLGAFAFSNCHSLGTVLLPSTLESIGDLAFGNSGLTGITIPGSVKKIGVSAFDNCYKLMRVTLEEGITSIGTSAFYDCKKLTEITLPDSLESMGTDVFKNCVSLKSIVLPQNLTTIPVRAFQGCENLEHVTLPPNTTHIEADAFRECPSLRSITLPATIQSLHGLPSTLQEIHISDLAAWCTANHSSWNHYLEHAGLYLNGELITDLVLPEGLTSIGGNAFENCTSLKQVTLPSTIQHIGNYAFSNATALHQVIYNGSTDDLNRVSIFSGNDNLLNASWKFSSLGSVAIYLIILPLTCLLQLGVLIACLVIYIRQRKYPFL